MRSSNETARVYLGARRRGGGDAYPPARAVRAKVGQTSDGRDAAVGTPASIEEYRGAFLQGMRDLGRTEGADFTFVERYSDGFLERLPALSDELARLKPDVILAQTSSAAQAAARATATIPIVVAVMADRLGLVGVMRGQRATSQVSW
jgi:ABC-type uncharacterized transport system substrate-binding protein